MDRVHAPISPTPPPPARLGFPGRTRRLLRGRRWVSFALLVSGAVVALVAARPASAADPTPAPTPIVFARPQYLEFWENHATVNGPVVDNVYALFTKPPEADGSLLVPDGDGGNFHYSARLVGGPYADDQALCAQMISLGIKSLSAWPPGQYAPTVTCDSYRPATPAPGTSVSSGGAAQGTGPTDEEIDIAAGLIGMLLFGGGLAGLALTGGSAAGGAIAAAGGVEVSPADPVLVLPPPAELPAEAPTSQPPAEQQPGQQSADPCSGQVNSLQAASLRARDLADGLQSARRFQAAMDQEVARLANWTIPMSFGVDLAFLLGGFASKLGPGLIAERLVWKVSEGMAKEVTKSLVKAALGADDPALVDLIEKAAKGGSKASFKDAIKEGLLARAAAQGTAGKELAVFSEQVAGPMADLLGHTWSIYSTVNSVSGLMSKLNEMRAQMLNLHESVSEFELVQRDALEAMAAARHALDFCRELNAPGHRW